jgi:mannose-6-phosphate isomerase-like protein (cupin superfamily)
MIIESEKESRTKFEYNCDLRRILPWPDKVNTNFSCAEATIDPNNKTKSHAHNYEEIFYIIDGDGFMYIDDQFREVKKGDLIYIPPNKSHCLENISEINKLKMICIWW